MTASSDPLGFHSNLTTSLKGLLCISMSKMPIPSCCHAIRHALIFISLVCVDAPHTLLPLLTPLQPHLTFLLFSHTLASHGPRTSLPRHCGADSLPSQAFSLKLPWITDLKLQPARSPCSPLQIPFILFYFTNTLYNLSIYYCYYSLPVSCTRI